MFPKGNHILIKFFFQRVTIFLFLYIQLEARDFLISPKNVRLLKKLYQFNKSLLCDQGKPLLDYLIELDMCPDI